MVRRNPLNRRWKAELKSDIGRYLMIFLLLVISVGVVSGFLVADGSMILAYDESFEKEGISGSPLMYKTGDICVQDEDGLFNQISDELKNSIFANVSNYYIFRVSKLDANVLVDNFNMKIPLDDTRERKIKLLTELNNRELIVRIDKNGIILPAFKATTLDFNSIPRIKRIEENRKVEKIIPKKGKNNFKIDSNINLKDILIKNSTSRKKVIE